MDGAGERAVSAVLGAVLLFGFLAIAFSVYQGVVVPNQNQAIEIAHNEQVQGSLQELRNAVREAGLAGTQRSVSIELGAAYPPRAVAVNFGHSVGQLRSVPFGAITVHNVSATDRETADYVGVTNTTLGPFATQALVYRPSYTFYGTAPITRLEHSVLYNQFPNGVNRFITNQGLIQGRQITLVTLAGNLSAARSGTVTVDTVCLSPASDRVAFTNSGGPITITFRSRLSVNTWTELLSDEYDPGGTASSRHVQAVSQPRPELVSIVLEPGVTYELALAKVSLGPGSGTPEPRYLTALTGNNPSVPEGGTWQLVVEVRDRFNNPVSNVSVRAIIANSANGSDPAEAVAPGSRPTDIRGRAAFVYTAPTEVNHTQAAAIDLTIAGGSTPEEVVTVELSVLDLDGSG
ncbi:MAG: hypothetical protein ABEH59_10065 [Halobacteriales archaeon]